MRVKENAALLDRIPEWQDNSRRRTRYSSDDAPLLQDALGYTKTS